MQLITHHVLQSLPLRLMSPISPFHRLCGMYSWGFFLRSELSPLSVRTYAEDLT